MEKNPALLANETGFFCVFYFADGFGNFRNRQYFHAKGSNLGNVVRSPGSALRFP